MQSRIVAVRSAFIDGLRSETGLTNVEVSFAWLAKSSRRERIFTRRARFVHAAAAMKAGRNFRDEVGTFDVVILVEGVGKSAEWTSERALELSATVEEYIADHKSNELEVDGLQTFQVAGAGEVVEMFNDSGHLAELSLPVRYTARLT